jgi:hypothetical protein
MALKALIQQEVLDPCVGIIGKLHNFFVLRCILAWLAVDRQRSLAFNWKFVMRMYLVDQFEFLLGTDRGDFPVYCLPC